MIKASSLEVSCLELLYCTLSLVENKIWYLMTKYENFQPKICADSDYLSLCITQNEFLMLFADFLTA